MKKFRKKPIAIVVRCSITITPFLCRFVTITFFYPLDPECKAYVLGDFQKSLLIGASNIEFLQVVLKFSVKIYNLKLYCY